MYSHYSVPLSMNLLIGVHLYVNICQDIQNCFNTFAGEVYTWGDNDEGQLGDGSTNAIQRPRLVAALQGNRLKNLKNSKKTRNSKHFVFAKGCLARLASFEN